MFKVEHASQINRGDGVTGSRQAALKNPHSPPQKSDVIEGFVSISSSSMDMSVSIDLGIVY
jgi:hypothetical protein